ncbi:hypothetical protein ACMFMG_006892 [Clarireedia jacksonii]
MICGQLVKGLLACDIAIDELWPDDAVEVDYDKFPVDSQSQKGWKADFQSWVDKAWPPNQQTVQTLFYNHSVTTIPPLKVGTPGLNIEMIFDEGYIVLYASFTEENFNQILELPCSIINHILLQPSSKTTVVQKIFDVAIEMEEDPARPCLLNSKVVVITTLCMTLTQDLEIFIDEVRRQCPKATFVDNRPRASTSQDFVIVQAPLDPWDSEGEGEGYFGSDERPRATVQLERQDSNTKTLGIGSEDRIEPVQDGSDDSSETRVSDLASCAPDQRDEQHSVKDDLQHTDIDEGPNLENPPVVLTHEDKDVIREVQISDSLSRSVESAISRGGDTLEAASDGSAFDNTRDSATSECYKNTSDDGGNSPLDESGMKKISSLEEHSMSKSQPKRFLVREEASIPEQKLKQYYVKAKPAIGSAVHMTVSKPNKRRIPPNASKQKGDIYDLSDDEESEAGLVKNGKPTKKTKPRVSGRQTKSKTNVKNGSGKPKVDHGKSATVEQVIPTRTSQRAAATKAKLNMRKLNSADEEELSDERESGPSQPNVSRKRKAVAEATLTGEQDVDVSAAIPNSIAVEQDEQLFSVEQNDEEGLGLVYNDSAPVVDIDQSDIYNVKPAVSQPEPEPESQLRPSGSQECYTNKRSRKNAASNFADKMAYILDSEGDGFQMLETNSALSKDSAPSRPQKIKAKGTLEDLPQIERPSLVMDTKKLSSLTEIDADGAISEAETQEALGFDIQENVEQFKAPSKETAYLINKMTQEGEEFVPPSTRLNEDGRANRDRSMEAIDKDTDVKADPLPITVGPKEFEHSSIATPQKRGHPRAASEYKATPIINAAVLNDEDRDHKDREDPFMRSHGSVSDEKKRKADRSTGAPSKRIRPNVSVQNIDPTVAQLSPLIESRNLLVQPEGRGNVLLEESTIRKPHLIHFDMTGARNQGISSVAKQSTTAKPKSKHGEENTEMLITDLGLENKRRRRFDHEHEENGFFPSESPPRKRQSVSPVQVVVSRSPDVKSSSPPAPPSKCSSQALKVNEFGSPIAHKSTDRILSIQEKLQESTASKLRDTSVPATAPTDPFDQGTPELFGQRLKMASITKARPDPPGDLPVRYVPHTKTQYGYEGILTMESVQEEKTLPDPFVEKLAHNSSHFTERLRAGTSADKELKSGKKGSLTSKSRIIDSEKTLVAFSSPSEMTSASSSSSTGQSASRTPIEHKPGRQWELAVRPHYRDYADVVHRIADEMVIRLVHEEDASMLIVQQYDDNGTRIIEGLARKRDDEKKKIQQALNGRTNDMVKMCSEASEFMREVQEGLKSSHAEDYEQAWRKRQEDIQKRIMAGRHATE